MSGESRLTAYRVLVEPRLDALLPPASLPPSSLHEAMRYAVLGGGKRLRPALSMASSVAVGARPDKGLDAGCAAEFVHCFSLIHDDLPAIDDDDMRRGRPTVHRKFNEAIAVLAGDALFALAFGTLASAADPVHVKRCLASLAMATGGLGLVGGEVMDVEGEGAPPDLGLIETIHRRKTGALISAACEMGGIVGGGNEAECASLREFGMELGLAFQIIDDVLNETATAQQLGKAAGSDRHRRKLTFPAAIGIDQSVARAKTLLDKAFESLCTLTGDTAPLKEIALSCVEREH